MPAIGSQTALPARNWHESMRGTLHVKRLGMVAQPLRYSGKATARRRRSMIGALSIAVV